MERKMKKIARTIYTKKMQQHVFGFAVIDAGVSVHPNRFLILVQVQMEKCLIHQVTINMDY